MVRYLSPTWFDRLRSQTETAAAPDSGMAAAAPDSGMAAAKPEGSMAAADGVEPAGALVLRHRVRGLAGEHSPAAGGDAADYDVVISAGRAVIRHPVHGPADLTFTSDYATAAAIAAGRLSTRAALAEGRLRVGGDVGILSSRASDVAGLDPVPAGLRAETEF
jgi:hypothetical protein